MGMVFQIDAVRKEFNAVSVDKDEALQKRLLRLERDRCSNYRKKVHNLQLELQHNCTGLGLKDPGRELEAVRFRSRMEAVQVATSIHTHMHCNNCIGKHTSCYSDLLLSPPECELHHNPHLVWKISCCFLYTTCLCQLLYRWTVVYCHSHTNLRLHI